MSSHQSCKLAHTLYPTPLEQGKAHCPLTAQIPELSATLPGVTVFKYISSTNKYNKNLANQKTWAYRDRHSMAGDQDVISNKPSVASRITSFGASETSTLRGSVRATKHGRTDGKGTVSNERVRSVHELQTTHSDINEVNVPTSEQRKATNEKCGDRE